MSEVAVLSLTGFLLARLDEDEAAAKASHPFADWWVDGPGEKSGWWWVYDASGKFKHREDAVFVARNDPRRVLAEVAAKRAIVELATLPEHQSFGSPWVDALLSLAAVYADHDDYRDEWKP